MSAGGGSSIMVAISALPQFEVRQRNLRKMKKKLISTLSEQGSTKELPSKLIVASSGNRLGWWVWQC